MKHYDENMKTWPKWKRSKDWEKFKSKMFKRSMNIGTKFLIKLTKK